MPGIIKDQHVLSLGWSVRIVYMLSCTVLHSGLQKGNTTLDNSQIYTYF